LIGIVLKEGIKVEVSKKMEKWAAQELQYADLGDTRRKNSKRSNGQGIQRLNIYINPSEKLKPVVPLEKRSE
jgi:hypothetical protein